MLLRLRHFSTALIFFVLAVVCLLSKPILAQNQNSKWFLGNGAALDFSSGTAVSIPGNSSFSSIEGLAAVSDRTTGAVLFYSNGLSVFNTNNAVIPNGNGILGAANIIFEPETRLEIFKTIFENVDGHISTFPDYRLHP